MLRRPFPRHYPNQSLLFVNGAIHHPTPMLWRMRRRREIKTSPVFLAHAQPAILRICQEAHAGISIWYNGASWTRFTKIIPCFGKWNTIKGQLKILWILKVRFKTIFSVADSVKLAKNHNCTLGGASRYMYIALFEKVWLTGILATLFRAITLVKCR